MGCDGVHEESGTLPDGEVARKFFYETVEQARAQEVISEEHFSVDGTLIEAWVSQKSFRPRATEGRLGRG